MAKTESFKKATKRLSPAKHLMEPGDLQWQDNKGLKIKQATSKVAVDLRAKLQASLRKIDPSQTL